VSVLWSRLTTCPQNRCLFTVRCCSLNTRASLCVKIVNDLHTYRTISEQTTLQPVKSWTERFADYGKVKPIANFNKSHIEQLITPNFLSIWRVDWSANCSVLSCLIPQVDQSVTWLTASWFVVMLPAVQCVTDEKHSVAWVCFCFVARDKHCIEACLLL